MDNIKSWLVNVGLNKMGPSAIRAALAFVVAALLAHQGALSSFGIVYDKANNIVSLHLSTLQEWMDGTGLGLIAALFTAIQHHTVATITGAPQTGAQGETK